MVELIARALAGMREETRDEPEWRAYYGEALYILDMLSDCPLPRIGRALASSPASASLFAANDR